MSDNKPVLIPFVMRIDVSIPRVKAAESDKHMQIARQIWATETGVQDPVFCSAPGTSDAALTDFSTVRIVEMFDGFYCTGTPSVGQFVQNTPDGGFILHDTLYSPRTRNGVAVNDVLDITVPQLRAAGMAPINLRAIVLTHGHSDHDGGVAALFTAAGRQVLVYVSNCFRVVNGGVLRFTTAAGASCTATTDANGLASCSISGLKSPTTITAEFQRLDGADGVDMDSRATRDTTL